MCRFDNFRSGMFSKVITFHIFGRSTCMYVHICIFFFSSLCSHFSLCIFFFFQAFDLRFNNDFFGFLSFDGKRLLLLVIFVYLIINLLVNFWACICVEIKFSWFAVIRLVESLLQVRSGQRYFASCSVQS